MNNNPITMNEDFAPFELAVKLKEKGFRELCLAYYTNDDTLYYNYSHKSGACYMDCYLSHNLMPKDSVSGKFVDAPTISQVLKWLRNEKKIYVSILPFATHSTIDKVAFYYLIEYNSTGETMEGIEQNTYCAEWKDAALGGIEYVLDNLI